MHQRHHGFHAVFPAAADHLPVMLDFFFVKLSFFRLDSCPLDGETVGVQSGLRHQADIFFVTVIVIACDAAGLGKAGMGHLLLRPVIAVDIVALHLMGGGGRSDQKVLWERHIEIPPYS